MSTDAWDDMQSLPDAADFPASAALSTERRSAVAVPRERPAAIAQELGQIFRSPRFRRQEEQETGPPAQRQRLPSTSSPSLDGPENQALGPRFGPQRNTTNRRSRRQLSRRSRSSTGSRFNRTVILIPDPDFSEVPRGRLREHMHDAGLEERVDFTSRMTAYEMRHAILRSFQGNGHFLNTTYVLTCMLVLS